MSNNLIESFYVMHVQTVSPDKFPSSEEISHFLSDVSTTKYHRTIVDRALKVAKEIPEIEAVFLTGSLGKDEGDLFSDIDFYVVIQDPEAKLKIKSHFLQNITRVGELIHLFFSTYNMDDFIIYFKPFVKFELGIHSYEQISKSWNLKNAKLLYDRNGLGVQAVETSRQIDFDIKDHETLLQNVAIALPSFCYIVAGFIVRGEHITALSTCNEVRSYMLQVSQLVLKIFYEGPRRAESRLPEEILQYFHKTQVKNVEGIWSALDIYLDWFSTWFIPRVERLFEKTALNEVDPMKMMLSILKVGYERKF
ncbi:MAG: nucleotidyltransferase domain-containing protein [Candidatus Kariarchaeaceae archaeon]